MPSSLNILYSFPHPLGRPGIGTTALNQVRALASLGVRVTLMCTSLHEDVPGNVRVHETLRVFGKRLPHRVFGSADRALAFHDHVVAFYLRRSAERFDVVHTWPQSALSTLSMAGRLGCLSSREVPNTHTANAYEQAAIESRIVGVALPNMHSHRPDPRRLALEEREYAGADLLMVPSDHVADTFLVRGFDPRKLAHHRYGFDDSKFSAEGRTEWPSRPVTAVFVGKCEPRKGLHYALEAWVRSEPPSDARFIIAGEFVPGYRDAVSEWLLEPSVHHRGFVRDVPGLLRESDLLVLPSVEEGSALVTYEAQASGCIPLVSDAAGAVLSAQMRPFVHSARDVGTLTTHLSTLARNARWRADLRSGLAPWSRGLTWEAAGKRMVEIYDEALRYRKL